MVRPASDRGNAAGLGVAGTEIGATDDFVARLRACSVESEAELADLIDADGRDRERLGLETRLERYLAASPELERMPVALDAAIEAALRSMCASGWAEGEAIASLVESFPALREPIADTVALNRGIWSTRWLIDGMGPAERRDLPCDVGPPIESGGSRYRLVDLLGRGSCGQVYRAVDRRLSDGRHQALVAVKLLDSRGASLEGRRRFLDEAMRARRVEHPSVVRVLDRGETPDGGLYIVYEHVRGRTLAQWARERGGRIDARDAAALVAKIARGVHAAHASGLIHCDLHPTNVLIDEEDEPRICDFGIAVLSEELGGGEGGDGGGNGGGGGGLGVWGGRALGSLAFIPPEQFALEEGSFGAPVDVYALGGLLHFLISGDLPNGSASDEIQKRLAEGEGATSRMKGCVIGVERDLHTILHRAMATSPSDRHVSTSALADDLHAWLARRPIEWTHPSLLRRAHLLVRRRPVLASLAMVAMIGLLLGASAFSYSFGVVHTRRKDVSDWYSKTRAELATLERQSDGAALLLSLWILDKFRTDAALGGDGMVPAMADTSRLEGVARMVEQGYAESGPSDPVVLLLETTQAMLMLVDRDPHPEVRRVIDRNRRGWSVMLPADSRVLRELDVMEAVADVKEEFFESRAGRPFDRAKLRGAEDVLLTSLPMYEGWYERSEMHTLAVRALRSLYGAHLLKDAMRYEEFRRVYLAMTGKRRTREADPTPEWRRWDEWRASFGDAPNSR